MASFFGISVASSVGSWWPHPWGLRALILRFGGLTLRISVASFLGIWWPHPQDPGGYIHGIVDVGLISGIWWPHPQVPLVSIRDQLPRRDVSTARRSGVWRRASGGGEADLGLRGFRFGSGGADLGLGALWGRGTSGAHPAVPQVLRSCTEFVEQHGVVDGIYRLSGVSSNIQRLR